jgi:high-affinity Fe2+/Pb2+ permease
MPMFADLGRYCLVALAAAAGATALCGLTGFGLMRFFPSISLVAMAGKMGIWGVLIVSPLVLWTLPEQVRAALRERIRRLAFSR